MTKAEKAKEAQREQAIALINELLNSIATCKKYDDAKNIGEQIHGIARLAFRLSLITNTEWENADKEAEKQARAIH